MSTTLEVKTPWVQEKGFCDGCAPLHAVDVVWVGDIRLTKDGALHPDSKTARLCESCVKKALACFSTGALAKEVGRDVAR